VPDGPICSYTATTAERIIGGVALDRRRSARGGATYTICAVVGRRWRGRRIEPNVQGLLPARTDPRPPTGSARTAERQRKTKSNWQLTQRTNVDSDSRSSVNSALVIRTATHAPSGEWSRLVRCALSEGLGRRVGGLRGHGSPHPIGVMRADTAGRPTREEARHKGETHQTTCSGISKGRRRGPGVGRRVGAVTGPRWAV
jgi:hypothetical protein